MENLENISRIGFDRSDLAVIAAINNAGIAMGRFSLVKSRLSSGELMTPYPNTEVICKQRYYVATLPNKHNQKVKLFIDWLVGITGKKSSVNSFCNHFISMDAWVS
ncbi:hypothetical protein NGY2020056_34790 [Vibrio cholerae]